MSRWFNLHSFFPRLYLQNISCFFKKYKRRYSLFGRFELLCGMVSNYIVNQDIIYCVQTVKWRKQVLKERGYIV